MPPEPVIDPVIKIHVDKDDPEFLRGLHMLNPELHAYQHSLEEDGSPRG
jgi:hypothetical protein